jgi:hypothetical protein
MSYRILLYYECHKVRFWDNVKLDLILIQNTEIITSELIYFCYYIINIFNNRYFVGLISLKVETFFMQNDQLFYNHPFDIVISIYFFTQIRTNIFNL